MSLAESHAAGAPSVDAKGKPLVNFVTGIREVLHLNRKLAEFSERCDQPGAMNDIAYFLSKPGVSARIPHLLMVSANGKLDLKNPDLDELVGVLLIFEQSLAGFGLNAFATNDRSGRNTLIARAPDRTRVAALTTRALLDRGAHIIMMSFCSSTPDALEPEVERPILDKEIDRKSIARWARRDRTVPGYLPLSDTYDATLAKMGQRTRSNLRYYRRRAERELGCTFLPQIEASREELLSFNKECMFAVPSNVAGWRFDALKEISDPFLMGVKDRDGRWLSMLGGRRYHGGSELLWQLNREGYAANSLGIVMRSYFIEHEIAQGSQRLYIEGGTDHPIRFSFMPENLTDMAVVRQSLTAEVMRRIALRYISSSNELAHMLGETDLKWAPC